MRRGLTAALTSGLGSDAAVARWPGFDAAYEVGLGILTGPIDWRACRVKSVSISMLLQHTPIE